ncbi:MAG: aldo/keto reductase [Pseudomonadota bacterium]
MAETPISLKSADGTPASRLCFGTMQFGGSADVRASQEMFEDCRAAGLSFFDTAHLYTDGKSEEILGELVQRERESLMIATKVAYTGGSTRDTIFNQFSTSQKRLGVDMVDILYLHRWDAGTPLGETFEALAELQAAGKIRHIGVSNFAAWQVMKAQAVAASLGTRIDILQPMYSLVKRQVEVEILPMALSEGMAVSPYSPLGGGLLTGKYAAGGEGRLTTDARYRARYGQVWMHEAARALAEQASEMGLNPTTLAVAWAAAHPAITAPIISARSAGQLAPSLAAIGLKVEPAVYDAVSALSPTPPPATDRLEEG